MSVNELSAVCERHCKSREEKEFKQTVSEAFIKMVDNSKKGFRSHTNTEEEAFWIFNK